MTFWQGYTLCSYFGYSVGDGVTSESGYYPPVHVRHGYQGIAVVTSDEVNVGGTPVVGVQAYGVY